jgi:WD40 repeat protein
MPMNLYLCPRCGKGRPSPMDACSSCDWQPIPISSAKRNQPERERQRRITRRTALSLLGSAGVLALGSGAWIWLTRPKPHPQLLLYTAHHGAQVTALTWSPDGNSIASGDLHGTIRIWDTASGETLHTCQKEGAGSVSSVSWSPDGASLLAGSANMLAIWDMQSGKQSFSTSHLTGPAAYSVQGTYKPCYLLYPLLVAACQDQHLVQVFPSTALTTPIASLQIGSVSALAFNPHEYSPDLAVVTASPTRKLVVYAGIVATTCAGSNATNTHLSYKEADPQFSPDTSTGVLTAPWGPGGSYLIGGTPPEQVKITWDYGTYTMPHPTAVVAAALCPARQDLPADAHPDGTYCVIGYIATADRAGAVRIWGHDQKYLTVMQTQQPVQALVWSPNGRFLAIVTSDGVVRIWQAGLSDLPALWTQAC